MEMAAPGWNFSPSDDKLTDDYLWSLIDGYRLPDVVAAVIHHHDVYSATPEKLVEGREAAPGTGNGDKRVWYFFTSVSYVGKAKKARGDGKGFKRRTIAAGGSGEIRKWHAETAAKEVKDSAVGGRFQKFSYKVQSTVSPKKFDAGGWLMTEYSIPSASDILVLCKIYRSPRVSSSSERSLSSSCPATVDMTCPGTKRKAAVAGQPEAPPSVRARLQSKKTATMKISTGEDNRALCFPGEGPAPVPTDVDVALPWSKEAYGYYMAGGEPSMPPNSAEKGDDMIGVSSGPAEDDGKLVFFDHVGVTTDDPFAEKEARRQHAPSTVTEKDAGLGSKTDSGSAATRSCSLMTPEVTPATCWTQRPEALGRCPQPAIAEAPGRCQELAAAATSAYVSRNEVISELSSEKWENCFHVLSTYVPPPVRYEDDDDYYLRLW